MKQIPGDEVEDENMNVDMSGHEMKKMLHKLLRNVKKVKMDVKEGVVSGTEVHTAETNVAVSSIKLFIYYLNGFFFVLL